jgi:membrane protein
MSETPRDPRELRAGPHVGRPIFDRPRQIPLAGWWAVAKNVRAEVGRDNLPLLAAGVAFYGFLAVFPGLIALITLYGVVADPGQVAAQIEQLSAVLPSQALGVLENQARQILGDPESGSSVGLGIGFAASVLAVLWSVSTGTLGLIRAVNAAYNADESRSFVRLRAIAFAFTLGAIAFVLFAVALVAVAPVALRWVGLGGSSQALIAVLRWPVLALAMIAGTALIYRYAPSRPPAGWRWVSFGSLVAAALWLAGSALFSWYVSSFARFNEVYGSLGAVIVLLLWIFLTAYTVLLGAEINHELERWAGVEVSPEAPP